jgi:hypothetical protein
MAATTKRRLRFALAGAQGPGELAKEVRKRLAIMARSGSFVDWQGVRALADDLETQRRAIVETVAKADPKEALDLLWKFMALAPSIFERSDDGSGTVIGVFHEACSDIGDVALQASSNPTTLGDRAFEALIANDYGQFDELIAVLAPALGRAGLEHLKHRMIDLSNRPVKTPAEKDRVKGSIYADEMAERSRISTVRLALTEIADALGEPPASRAAAERSHRSGARRDAPASPDAAAKAVPAMASALSRSPLPVSAPRLRSGRDRASSGYRFGPGATLRRDGL